VDAVNVMMRVVLESPSSSSRVAPRVARRHSTTLNDRGLIAQSRVGVKVSVHASRARAANVSLTRAAASKSDRSFVIEPFHSIVGARKARRKLSHKDFEEFQRVDRESGGGGVEALRETIERERAVHESLKRDIYEAERAYANDSVIKALKQKKLRAKDALMALERELKNAERARAIGEGSFGRVYRGKDATTGLDVAVKVEDVEENPESPSALEREHEALRAAYASDHRCFPRLMYFGRQNVMGRQSRVLVMDLLDLSLEELSLRAGGAGFSRATVLRIAEWIIRALRACHRVGVVHGDVKPDNLLVERHAGASRGDAVKLVDFGEAVIWDDTYKKTIEDVVPPHRWSGTAMFSSANVDLGCVRAPRDDLLSAIYCLAYLRTGRLPWTNKLNVDGEVNILELGEAKRAIATGASLLTPYGKCDVSEEYAADIEWFNALLEHARSLRADDIPDYAHLCALTTAALEEFGPERPPYDWQSLTTSTR
jgi:casein kinase 1